MRWFKHVLLVFALAVLVAPAAPHGAAAHAEAAPITEAAGIAEASDGSAVEEQVIIRWYGYWDPLWQDCPTFCSWFKSNPFCDCYVEYVKVPSP